MANQAEQMLNNIDQAAADKLQVRSIPPNAAVSFGAVLGIGPAVKRVPTIHSKQPQPALT